MTVPFIMALGVGVSAVRNDREAGGDSFGLVALCSIGPIITVLLLGLLYQPDGSTYTPVSVPDAKDTAEMFRSYTHALPEYFKEIFLSLAPILAFFVLFQLVTRRMHRREVMSMLFGLLYTYIGLVLFLTGVNVGFMPVGSFLGESIAALVDTDDIHAMVTAASGAGKTAFFLYPNIEYALASGMSFLCTDTKGDLFRNYAGIAKDCYGYQIAVLDLRNPTRSDGNNLLHLINKYMDIYKADPKNLAAKAKAEKYSKILAKTLINTSGGDSAQYGQNAFFYDSAEGLLTAMFLLVAMAPFWLPNTGTH